MQIVILPINELREYENNPRHNENAVDKVAASIDKFGFKVPVVIDIHNVIVAGHTRVRAARKLGMESVPCIIADDLNDEQIKAFRLADNKTGEFAAWDLDKLNAELAELSEIDFDMSVFGFNPLSVDDDFDGEDLDKENEKTGKVQVQITFETYTDYELIADELKSLAETNNGAVVVRTI